MVFYCGLWFFFHVASPLAIKGANLKLILLNINELCGGRKPSP